MSGLQDLTTPARHDELTAVLAAWVPRQRWFAGKARTPERFDVAEAFVVQADEAEVLVVLADVTYADGGAERYHMPLVAEADAAPEAAVGTVAALHLVDASFVRGAAALLPQLALEARPRPTPSGATLVGHPVGANPPKLGTPRRLNAEQSNTSIALGDAHIFKIFRRLEFGTNPDVEISRALTEAGFPNTPAQRGAVELHLPDGNVISLGVLNDFVAGARDAWELAVDEVGAVVRGEASGDVLAGAADLGAVIAELHATLREAFGTRDATAADRGAWADAMRQQVEAVLETARRRAPDAVAAVVARRDELVAALGRLREDDTPAPLTRTHGDLHLGQVLLDGAGAWQILDFEGEPARPLTARRDLHAPLRDVAGMLRSFDYAAAAGSGGDLARVPEAAARWRDDARAAFIDAYLATAGKHGVLPPAAHAVATQLDAFELDKAVYELGYELANRPDWVPIPVGGIVRVLQQP